MIRRHEAEKRTEKKPSRWRVFLVQLLLLHAGLYAIVMVGLFLVNLLSGITQPWFLFPAFGWGLVLAMHGFVLYVLLNWGFARKIVSRTERRNDPSYRPKRKPASEIEELVMKGRAVLAEMRADVRSIPNPAARSEAFATCQASEQVLLAIEEHPDEVPLARDFVHRFLEPAGKMIGDYARLARRNVPSAQDMLRDVERVDLPRLTERATAMFDRVHRGTIIDLAVAREMMALDATDVETARAPIASGKETA